MSIKLLDTIYKLTDNSDKLDGYHRNNLYTSIPAWITATELSKGITVEGDSDKFYPVVISVSSSKEMPTFISIQKDLGTKTPSLSGNHSNGTSSLWLRYEMRNTMWDGNGGYIKTWYKYQGYATLVAHTRTNIKGHGGLIVWLRGGSCSYTISCTNSFNVNIYYSSTNIGSSDHPDNVAPITSVDNGGIYTSTTLGYGNISGNASTASKLATARTISLTGSVTGSGSFDGSGNLSIATTTNHSHSYASKVTVGTTAYSVSSNNITIPAYPTSLKCPNSLTIQGNGSSLGSYDGSAAKTINITPAAIGAAASGHTHDYAASSHSHEALASGWYTTFTVNGDANTYYPVVLSSVSSKYPMQLVNISRGYSETAPNSWNTSTHRGGLTLTLLWNGSKYWDGNGSGSPCHCVYKYESYCTMVGGLGNSTAGIVVWLRGGGAVYYLHSMNGGGATATVHLSTYTDSASQSFAPKTSVSSFSVGWPYALNADKVDNKDSSAFAAASHNHDSAYAAKSHTHRYAASSHTHNYAGSSSAGGKANDSDKVDGYHISVGSSAGSDANTIYYIV